MSVCETKKTYTIFRMEFVSENEMENCARTTHAPTPAHISTLIDSYDFISCSSQKVIEVLAEANEEKIIENLRFSLAFE